jgi:hypothetical protein
MGEFEKKMVIETGLDSAGSGYDIVADFFDCFTKFS